MILASGIAMNRQWALAGALALVAHGGAIALAVAAGADKRPAPYPEPAILVTLPPAGDTGQNRAEPAGATQAAAMDKPGLPQEPRPQPADARQPEAPLPDVAATQPQPAPPPEPVTQPLARIPTTASQPTAGVQAVTPPGPGTGPVATGLASGTEGEPGEAHGSDPKARQRQADYFSMVSAHLNRRKTYPAEAKKARQQGIVTVRFTVARNGDVSAVSIKRSSGHERLDLATLDLMHRVSPLPPFPKSMRQDSITLSLPIDYSLRTY